MDNMLNEFDEKDRSIKTNDLKTRERVNFVVDATIMKKIRDLSAERKIPMSRMIDHAIATTYGLFAKSIFISWILRFNSTTCTISDSTLKNFIQ